MGVDQQRAHISAEWINTASPPGPRQTAHDIFRPPAGASRRRANADAFPAIASTRPARRTCLLNLTVAALSKAAIAAQLDGRSPRAMVRGATSGCCPPPTSTRAWSCRWMTAFALAAPAAHAFALPRPQESRRARRDGCIARTMRKPDRTELPAVAALLLSSELRLLVRHERARLRRPTPATPLPEKRSCARPPRDDSFIARAATRSRFLIRA